MNHRLAISVLLLTYSMWSIIVSCFAVMSLWYKWISRNALTFRCYLGNFGPARFPFMASLKASFA